MFRLAACFTQQSSTRRPHRLFIILQDCFYGPWMFLDLSHGCLACIIEQRQNAAKMSWQSVGMYPRSLTISGSLIWCLSLYKRAVPERRKDILIEHWNVPKVLDWLWISRAPAWSVQQSRARRPHRSLGRLQDRTWDFSMHEQGRQACHIIAACGTLEGHWEESRVGITKRDCRIYEGWVWAGRRHIMVVDLIVLTNFTVDLFLWMHRSNFVVSCNDRLYEQIWIHIFFVCFLLLLKAFFLSSVLHVHQVLLILLAPQIAACLRKVVHENFQIFFLSWADGPEVFGGVLKQHAFRALTVKLFSHVCVSAIVVQTLSERI